MSRPPNTPTTSTAHPRKGADESSLRTLHVERAARVLATEADAIAVLSRSIPEDFVAVVELLLEARGRVIVSGMGKSGHVARKIAATLASTGTPALFVHPAEASHGDLGMIAAGDACILVSNSGETPELGDLIAHCGRFGIPLIGVSARATSTLMRAADLRLELPDAQEACPIGMAPTTSTTMTMALGDALAVALMEARGFAPEDFNAFHPGGRLGARLARVESFMHDGDALPIVTPDAPMADVLLTMTSGGFGIAVVVDPHGRLEGVVTDGDLRRHMDGLLQRTAGMVATPDPITVRPDLLASRALATMNERKITVLVVVDDDRRAVGVLHVHDLLRAGVA